MLVDTLVTLFATTADGDTLQRGTGGKRSRRLDGVRILLVEDNEINQQIAVELLEGAGATVTVADNGREAVDELSGRSAAAPSTSS